jgi:radical SAM protein with 4Fe4S-binding SPASM domain
MGHAPQEHVRSTGCTIPEGGRAACPPVSEWATFTNSGDEARHTLETVLANRLVRRLLGAMTRPGGDGGPSWFERLSEHYHDGSLDPLDRVKWMLPSALIDLAIRLGHADGERLERELFHHQATVRALTVSARSIARYGPMQPQRFAAPLLVVWNITDLCNLSCRHCYQDAGAKRTRVEMTREEKLAAVDEMGRLTLPMLAIAGGEPLACPDLFPVIERARMRGIHVTVASNGTLVTEAMARRLKQAGVQYLEISVDSPDADEHDSFRAQRGSWARAVAGIRNGVKAGLDLGLATCLTNESVHRVDDLVQLAVDLGCETFSHFNFIPVGRGRDMLVQDLDPEQRERLLIKLNEHLQRNRLKIISTAPQFGRACVMYAPPDGIFAQGHGGRAPGAHARVLARYIGGCGAGRCYCALEPDGSVTPCVYMRSHVVGNIRDRSLAEIWDNELFALLSDRSRRTGHCRVCAFRSYCGGCRARAFAYTGDVTASDPGCIANIGLWNHLNAQAEDSETECAWTPDEGRTGAGWQEISALRFDTAPGSREGSRQGDERTG